MTSREHRSAIAIRAAEAIEAKAAAGELPTALIGFDGFVDEIIHVVGRRRSMQGHDFERIATIPEFAARAAAASGRSANIEMYVNDVRFGGNAPLMGGAMGRLGAAVDFIGAVGHRDDHTRLDPLFEPFADRCRSVRPIARPGHTDALEFTDGKLMLGKAQTVQEVTWDRIKDVVGLSTIIDLADGADIIGVTNWVMLGGVEGIWEGLRDEVFPGLSDRPRRFVVDLSDPAKRRDEAIARAMGVLRTINDRVPVTLGLNLAESQRVAGVTGLKIYDESHNYSLGALVKEAASQLREALGLECVVVHPREGAAAANSEGAAWFEGPFTANPKLSTGAGDHFNGGFAFGRAIGLGVEESLAVGCAVSGAYVRDAVSPDLARLVGFLRDLPGSD